MINPRCVAFALLCLTLGDKPAAAPDARAIFEASAHALAPATRNSAASSPVAVADNTRWAPSAALMMVARTRLVLPVAWLMESRICASVLCVASTLTVKVLSPESMVSVPVPTSCAAPSTNGSEVS